MKCLTLDWWKGQLLKPQPLINWFQHLLVSTHRNHWHHHRTYPLEFGLSLKGAQRVWLCHQETFWHKPGPSAKFSRESLHMFLYSSENMRVFSRSKPHQSYPYLPKRGLHIPDLYSHFSKQFGYHEPLGNIHLSTSSICCSLSQLKWLSRYCLQLP